MSQKTRLYNIGTGERGRESDGVIVKGKLKGRPYCGQPPSACSVTSTQPPPPTLPEAQPHPSLTLNPAPSPALCPTPLKPGQGGFRKVCRTEEAGPSPFPGLPAGVLEMRVKEGSKIRNLMGFAMARMQGGGVGGVEGGAGGSEGGVRQVVFAGSGRAVTKTITCAEIMKRKVGGLHQLTKLRYRAVREVWESREGGASEMTIHRNVPSISILLSKDPLDPSEPGYQPPEALSVLWEPPAHENREGGGDDPPEPRLVRDPSATLPQPVSQNPRDPAWRRGTTLHPPQTDWITTGV